MAIAGKFVHTSHDLMAPPSTFICEYCQAMVRRFVIVRGCFQHAYT